MGPACYCTDGSAAQVEQRPRPAASPASPSTSIFAKPGDLRRVQPGRAEGCAAHERVRPEKRGDTAVFLLLIGHPVAGIGVPRFNRGWWCTSMPPSRVTMTAKRSGGWTTPGPSPGMGPSDLDLIAVTDRRAVAVRLHERLPTSLAHLGGAVGPAVGCLSAPGHGIFLAVSTRV